MNATDGHHGKRTVATESGEGRYHLTINASGHHLEADEPVGAGGDDRGPNPYDLLCAALSACTIITLRMYAERKDYTITKLETEITHTKKQADPQPENAGGRPVLIDVFSRQIRIEGDITEEQRQRMLEIAVRCPVARTLENNAIIHSALA